MRPALREGFLDLHRGGDDRDVIPRALDRPEKIATGGEIRVRTRFGGELVEVVRISCAPPRVPRPVVFMCVAVAGGIYVAVRHRSPC